MNRHLPLSLSGVDVVIVAIGENFGASIRVVALLKQQKVAHHLCAGH